METVQRGCLFVHPDVVRLTLPVLCDSPSAASQMMKMKVTLSPKPRCNLRPRENGPLRMTDEERPNTVRTLLVTQIKAYNTPQGETGTRQWLHMHSADRLNALTQTHASRSQCVRAKAPARCTGQTE